jgi:uncharacterized membrane protein YfhO
MVVPAGIHQVEFKFEPQCFYTGEKIALASSLLLVIILAGVGYVEFRKKQ